MAGKLFQFNQQLMRLNVSFTPTSPHSAILVIARSHMTIGMTTGWQTYANYLAAHWLTVYQWS